METLLDKKREIVGECQLGWLARTLAGPQAESCQKMSSGSPIFILRGQIRIVGTPDAGRPCIKENDSEFAITQDRKYWRLRDFEYCDQLTDYIDIYF